jgi:hypothetical protein
MKKCSPFHGQNGQLVHWWVLLVHSGREKVGPGMGKCGTETHYQDNSNSFCKNQNQRFLHKSKAPANTG